MLRIGLALLSVVAFLDAGCDAFSNPALYALRAPAVGMFRSATPRIAGHSSVSMKSDNVVGRRAALLSLALLGAGASSNPKTAYSVGAPLSAKETEEYAKLLEEVSISQLI